MDVRQVVAEEFQMMSTCCHGDWASGSAMTIITVSEWENSKTDTGK